MISTMHIACRINLLGDIRIRNISGMGLHRVTSQSEESSRADWNFDTPASANPNPSPSKPGALHQRHKKTRAREKFQTTDLQACQSTNSIQLAPQTD